MPVNTMTFDQLAARVKRAPYHRWLDIALTHLDENGIEITMPWRDEFLTSVDPPFAHGGVLAALIDLTADYAVAAKAGRGAPTVDMRIDYLRPAKPGALRARGQVVKLGKTLATADATVYDEAGVAVATGRAVFFMGGG